MPATDAPRSKVVNMELPGGRVASMSRNDLVRLAAGRQLATMVMMLVEQIHRTDKGRPVDLHRNPQWQEIYRDPSPDIRIMASAQVGKTLYATLRCFAAAELGFETGLVLPTDPKRNEFVHNRVERTLNNTPHYQRQIDDAGGTNSTREKHYRSRDGSICPLHFVASASDNELIAFSADQMIVDEKDRCDRDNLKLVPSRMNQSDYRLTLEQSTPTIPGYASTKAGEAGPDNIHTEFLNGTQFRWNIRCDACGHEQVPTWEENVVKIAVDESGRITGYTVRDRDYVPGGPADVRVCCCACDAPMDRLAPGRWVSENPGATVHSYWVNRLCAAVGEPLSAILGRFGKAINNPSAMQQVYNMDLGLPYSGGFVGFREELFRACCGGYPMDSAYEGVTTAGIDVNVPFFDVHISSWHPESPDCPQRKRKVAKVQGRENLYALLRLFNVKVAVIDQQPETNLACEIQRDAPDRCGCRVVRAKYSTHPTIDPVTVSKAGENPGDLPVIITLDRLSTLDAVYQSMLNRRVMYFLEYATVLDGAMLREFVRPTRTVEDDARGEPRFNWVGKPDHQLHAANLDLIAAHDLVGRMHMGTYTGVLGSVVDYTHSRPAAPISSGGPPEAALAGMLRARGIR